MTESVESPERIWIESEGGCPYFYHEDELSDVGSPVTEYVRADKLEELAAAHDEAEARANKLEKILRAYQKAVNRIDDLIEYALPMPRETKGALYSVLADLTEELVKESKA